MKKNLLSVLVLVLVVVNIAMSAVMMISVIGTNKKTAELITSIATVLNLELYNPGGTVEVDVPLDDIVVHDMVGFMIPLARSKTMNADGSVTEGKQAYFGFDLALQMNSKHEDYNNYGTNITDRNSLLQDVVEGVISSHTEEECRDNFDSIKEELLQAIQGFFGSDFVFQISVYNKKFG
ncbi:MAG: hypothetical protein HFH82_05620 [Lachnospiraceae bacterium]|nr:hypothetical protein [Lachnospiraceae bacterium]